MHTRLRVLTECSQCGPSIPQEGLHLFPGDSEEQQAALLRVAEKDAYNWG